MDYKDENKTFSSALKIAVGRGDVKTVRRLVKGGINVGAKQTSWYKTSLLHDAVSTGKLEIISLLIEAKADVNAVNEDKRSALHMAARSGKKDIVEQLIKAGAKLNARTSAECDMKGAAVMKTNLHRQVAKGVVSKQYLEGSEIPDCSDDGRTALHIALWRGKIDVVTQLVNAGADVNIKDEGGWTPLYWAANMNYLDVCKMLARNGVKVNPVNKRGQTPLHIAITNGHFNTAKYLIDEGADLNISVQGCSIVSLLLQYKHLNSNDAMDILTHCVQHGFNLRNDPAVKKGILLKRFQKNETFLSWFQSIQTNIQPLAYLCRIQIRTHLSKCGENIHPSIDELPLPKLVIRFLKFDSEQAVT